MGSYPDWVLKHKSKGTEIRKIGQRYYLYNLDFVQKRSIMVNHEGHIK